MAQLSIPILVIAKDSQKEIPKAGRRGLLEEDADHHQRSI